MDKVLLINKEKGVTSRDVVNSVSKILNTKKVGHFGTLDPLATGLLVLGLGTCTKIGNLFTDESKEYEVEVLLGTSTDTYDITGKVLKKEEISIDEKLLTKHLYSFLGIYNQEVPIYSAVKVNGKKLYEYARNNESVTLPKKEVTIKKITFNDLYTRNNETYFSFTCQVSKGTYIRSLINDLSNKMNIPMCMSNLKRTKCGSFSLKESYTIEDIKNNNYSFLNIEDVLDVEVKEIPSSLEKNIINGTMISKISNKMILFTKDNKPIALYSTYQDGMKPYLTFKK